MGIINEINIVVWQTNQKWRRRKRNGKKKPKKKKTFANVVNWLTHNFIEIFLTNSHIASFIKFNWYENQQIHYVAIYW